MTYYYLQKWYDPQATPGIRSFVHSSISPYQVSVDQGKDTQTLCLLCCDSQELKYN